MDEKEINQILEDAWLNIKVDEEKLFNPLKYIPPEFEEEPHLYIMWLFTQPEYFSLVCKEIMNVELLPMQLVILQEFWHRKFPMLITARGGSKSWILGVYALLRLLLLPGRRIVICGAAFRQSKIISNYMESVWYNAPILRSLVGTDGNGPRHEPDMYRFHIGESVSVSLPVGMGDKIRGQRAHDLLIDEFSCIRKDTVIQTSNGLIKVKDYLDGEVNDLLNMNGEFETPDKIFVTPLTNVYKITTQNGYSFCCSSIHKVMTVDGWKTAKNLTTDDFLELDCNNYFPERYIKDGDLILDEDIGWLMGVLVAEGTNTNRNYIQITNTDYSLIKAVKERLKYDWKLYTKDAYIDKRGWKCKKSYNLSWHNTELRESLYKFGLDYVISNYKTIPKSILQSPMSVIVEFLKGLYLGDGSIFTYKDKNKIRVGVSYYSASKELIDVLQVLLLKFGIMSTKITRGSTISDNPQWMLSCRGYQAYKLVNLLDDKDFMKIVETSDYFKYRPYIRKNGKRFVVSTHRANRSLHIGTFDSREKCIEVFNKYIEDIKPCFRIKSVTKLPDQEVLYDFHLPKTHSFIGNGFIQHNSLSREIFETVMSGFLAVKSSPVENVKQQAKIKVMKELNLSTDEEKSLFLDNQLIISGTAYYDFNHFADYWKRWKTIIKSKGDIDKLVQAFGDIEDVQEGLNYKDYSIIRIPYELIPKGLMDEAMIARSKATMHSGTYLNEFAACFSSDSNGFFKRSLIESCVVSLKNEIKFQKEVILFHPVLKGNPGKKYIFGVDPASEVDNFSIVILEIHLDHRRIIYSWTTTRAEYRIKVRAGLVSDMDFYGYCARKIRDLMEVFPCERIAIDSQGGGVAVSEALHDKDKLREGEMPIWSIIDPIKLKDTDVEVGVHILEMINFSSAEWTSDANHGLRKDLEDKICLFPCFDPAMIELASIKDNSESRLYDTLEDCIMEIEELKDELSTIIIERTPAGRDRWSTPEIKLPGNKKGRMRKDRYSSLLMANMTARTIARDRHIVHNVTEGNFASTLKLEKTGTDYSGPAIFIEKMRGVYD